MQGEKKNPSNRSPVCSFWGSGTWKRLRAPEPPHVRIFVWNFPSCPRQLFHILSACLLSGFIWDDEGPRCSAMRCSSNPPFFDTWQIINGGLAALRRSSERTHQIRCLTAHVRTDKNLLLAIFMSLFHHSSWLWIWLRAEFLQVLVTFV